MSNWFKPIAVVVAIAIGFGLHQLSLLRALSTEAELADTFAASQIEQLSDTTAPLIE